MESGNKYLEEKANVISFLDKDFQGLETCLAKIFLADLAFYNKFIKAIIKLL